MLTRQVLDVAGVPVFFFCFFEAKTLEFLRELGFVS